MLPLSITLPFAGISVFSILWRLFHLLLLKDRAERALDEGSGDAVDGDSKPVCHLAETGCSSVGIVRDQLGIVDIEMLVTNCLHTGMTRQRNTNEHPNLPEWPHFNKRGKGDRLYCHYYPVFYPHHHFYLDNFSKFHRSPFKLFSSSLLWLKNEMFGRFTVKSGNLSFNVTT